MDVGQVERLSGSWQLALRAQWNRALRVSTGHYSAYIRAALGLPPPGEGCWPSPEPRTPSTPVEPSMRLGGRITDAGLSFSFPPGPHRG